MPAHRSWLAAASLLVLLTACGSSTDPDPTPDPDPDPDPDPNPSGWFPYTPTPPAIDACEVLGLDSQALDVTGPFGTLRHDLADDFTVTELDGSTWQLSERWSGCESYLFVPSGRIVSAIDSTSIWERDVDALIATSPPNAHYFFVATRDPAEAPAELAAMQARVDEALLALEPDQAEWWRAHLHVVAEHRSELDGWLGTMLAGLGAGGFGIDRTQRLRLLGSFADVTRYSNILASQNEWPWEANLAYAAYEAQHWEYESTRNAYLASHEATVVTPWEGEVLAEIVETTVDFPSATEMAAFDTFEIDLTMDCPDPAAGEFGKCGAWDYLSHIYLLDDDGVTWLELARFITTYHREGRYLVDATPMMVHLLAGGSRQIRFEVSPPWNPQAYLTKMDFRFSTQGRAEKPREATFLFAGGNFNATYNDAYTPIDVAIPDTATKVELWAIITGHGGDAFNCAEFCNHQHAFTVGSATHTKVHDVAGTEQGCMDAIAGGMVPNQGGTWWFGRGGWCPGQQVEPWVVDVTADVTPGQNVTVSYEGLFNGNTPPDNAGNIRMASYLVVYE
ncbi:MAG: peptide-N-glycosidase F-related protein [Polyangiaceae bacterium]